MMCSEKVPQHIRDIDGARFLKVLEIDGDSELNRLVPCQTVESVDGSVPRRCPRQHHDLSKVCRNVFFIR